MASVVGGAHRGDLHAEAGRSSCPGGGTSGPAHGFAVLTESTSGKISVDVSLKNGAPTRMYTVHLVQCLGSSDTGHSTIGTFKTDARGNGTFLGDATKVAGVDHAFVGLDGGTGQIYATNALAV
jgi:hypothetical protein